MNTPDYTPTERVFRGWMLISACVYALAIPFFLLAGAHIVPVINTISAPLFPLPEYPLPPSGIEGAFWRILGVSMMAMLTWACVTAYSDVRGKGWVVHIVLLSKLCSTLSYLAFFAARHQLAYLVGALTDGPIFLCTLALWYAASARGRLIDAKEEDILSAIGEAIVPHGGAFALGFRDIRTECLADIRRMLAALDPMTLLATRLILRLLNAAPIFRGLRPRTLRSMPPAERSEFLARIEGSRFSSPRMMFVMIKVLVLFSFFNHPAAQEAVGYAAPAEVE